MLSVAVAITSFVVGLHINEAIPHVLAELAKCEEGTVRMKSYWEGP